MATLESRIERIPEEIDISTQRQATCEEQISRAPEHVGHIFPHPEQVKTLSTEVAGLETRPGPPPPRTPEPPFIDLRPGPGGRFDAVESEPSLTTQKFVQLRQRLDVLLATRELFRSNSVVQRRQEHRQFADLVADARVTRSD